MKQKEMKQDDRISISGDVKYGDGEYRVASKGIIVTTGRVQSLINIDNIDGDGHANVFVKNKYIFKIEE